MDEWNKLKAKMKESHSRIEVQTDFYLLICFGTKYILLESDMFFCKVR